MPHPSARRLGRGALVAALAVVIPAAAGAQIAVGRTDTFQDGTTQGWAVNILNMGNHPAPPANIATGGPAGAGDRYLQLTSVGGDGAGSRLTALNFNGQWAGDYRAAGVNAITMDVRNLGGVNLFLRLMLEDPTMTSPPQNLAMSAAPIVVRTGGDWERVVFPLFGPGGLAPLAGDLDLLLGRVTVLRLLSNEAFDYPPAQVAARVGVDNITAAVIPEPATFALVGGGVLLLAGVRRARGRRAETK